MNFLYNFILFVSENLLKIFGNFFGQKVHYFKDGQKRIFKQLKTCLKPEKPVIWIHVSSLGEYEQALPVIEQLKEDYPSKQLLLTFFSPSGYEIKKNKTPADCVTYLPIDRQKNVKKFLDLVKPQIVIFIKYDLWPNYLNALKKRQIPVYLVSAIFKPDHKFFKSTWLKNSLGSITHFFVQDEASKSVLNRQGFTNVSITGDTRFDRVYQISKKTADIGFVKSFKQDYPLLIAGSTWPKDESLLTQYVNKSRNNFKTIIAPHEIDDNHIKDIVKKLKKSNILYTDIKPDTDLSKYDVLILNTIGLLNKIYRYADVVYIGNGFGKSIHNVQEPAIFGVPILTGPHIEKFKEAVDLQRLGGLVIIQNFQELIDELDRLLTDEDLRKQKAIITKNYALKNIGATDKIVNFLRANL